MAIVDVGATSWARHRNVVGLKRALRLILFKLGHAELARHLFR